MDQTILKLEMQNCARLLYQNRGKDVYKIINELLPELNRELQRLANMPEYMNHVLLLTNQFLEAYRRQDTLALADLLGGGLVQIIVAAEMECGNESYFRTE